MLVYIGYVLLALILAAAGILAWRNSRIIAEQRKAKGAVPAVSSYTVQVSRQAEADDPERITPLFEAVYPEPQGTVRVCLCRVNGTISELKLSHAVQIMEHTCSEFAVKAAAVQARAYHEAVRNEEESSAVARLARTLGENGN